MLAATSKSNMRDAFQAMTGTSADAQAEAA
jgi:hypothetical protein